MIIADVVFGGALALMLGITSASLRWNMGILISVAAILGFAALFA